VSQRCVPLGVIAIGLRSCWGSRPVKSTPSTQPPEPPMKPRFKLSTDGRITLVHAGLSGLNEQQTRQLIVSQYGSVVRYCSRVGLSYEAVHLALHPARNSKRVDATTATRIVLGLPLPGVKKMGFHTISGYTKSVYALLADGHAARQYPEATSVALSKEFGLAGASLSPVLQIGEAIR
jgi:hypothetical protein